MAYRTSVNKIFTMDADRKINLEGVPLNSAGAANIFLNTGKNKINDRDGTVIHLKTGDF